MILFKPAFAPFALIGIKRRRWWVAMGVLCLAALPFGAMWLDYATVIRNSSLSASYGLINLPLMVAPLIAWVGRRRPERSMHLEANALARGNSRRRRPRAPRGRVTDRRGAARR